jgi:hypothetical protein
MDRALEAVEDVRLAVPHDLERLVVHESRCPRHRTRPVQRADRPARDARRCSRCGRSRRAGTSRKASLRTGCVCGGACRETPLLGPRHGLSDLRPGGAVHAAGPQPRRRSDHRAVEDLYARADAADHGHVPVRGPDVVRLVPGEAALHGGARVHRVRRALVRDRARARVRRRSASERLHVGRVRVDLGARGHRLRQDERRAGRRPVHRADVHQRERLLREPVPARAPGSTRSRVHPASRSRPRSASWASARRRSSPRHRQGVACTVPATRPRPRGTS